MAKFRRIGTTSLMYGDPRLVGRPEKEREAVLHYIERAGKLGIDILLFQEEFGFTWTSHHLSGKRRLYAPGELRAELPDNRFEPEELAIGLDDGYIADVRKAARAAGVNVALPIVLRDGGRIYNSLLPVTSEGELLTPYRKMYPVIGELNTGVSAGTDNPAQWLAGVPVGFSICADITFDEVFEAARSSGAKLMLWSAMWMGGSWLRARTTCYGFYMVSSTPDGCTFADMDGSLISETYTSYPLTYGDHNLMFEDLNFDRDVFHCAAGEQLNDIAAKYGRRVHIRNRPQDVLCTIETLDESLSIEEVQREFNLISHYDYVKMSRAARNKSLS